MDLVESTLNEKEKGRHPWELARLEVIKNLLRSYRPDLQKQAKFILDIGCGDSWLIENLKESFENAKFIAVDSAFSDELIHSYQERLGNQRFSFSTSVEDGTKGVDQIEIVLLLDVIEHIEDEVSFLQKTIGETKGINSNTLFLITVPAFASLFSSHDHFLKHYRRYTKASLKMHLESSGLEVLQSGYFFASLLIPRALIKLAEVLGMKSRNAKGIGDHHQRPSDLLIKNILLFDYKLGKLFRRLGIPLPGLSTFAMARPKAKNLGK